ncbi:hypothetical protein F0562_013833 [Nyssa sinensis]|uniref:Uncharacterized protein n=1 Tax=Nyssa sinensis TaxID=561372 RepID=A0A5J4ZL28_9ASTE|nr:hypothetical protein F0562_013833 [Nyssa sinensis]
MIELMIEATSKQDEQRVCYCSNEEELEESFDFSGDEKPNGSEGDKGKDKKELELEESFDHFSGDENPLCSDGEEDGDYDNDGISRPTANVAKEAKEKKPRSN